MQAILDKLNKKYPGWIFVNVSVLPTMGARAEQTFVITLKSPDTGDSVTLQESIQIANVLSGDVTTGK